MGQYLDLAKQSAQRSLPMPDVIRPATPSHGGCDVPMPGVHICWQRQDGHQARGIVDQVYIDETPMVWVFVTHDDGAWSVLNPRIVKLFVLNAPVDTTRGDRGGASETA